MKSPPSYTPCLHGAQTMIGGAFNLASYYGLFYLETPILRDPCDRHPGESLNRLIAQPGVTGINDCMAFIADIQPLETTGSRSRIGSKSSC